MFSRGSSKRRRDPDEVPAWKRVLAASTDYEPAHTSSVSAEPDRTDHDGSEQSDDGGEHDSGCADDDDDDDDDNFDPSIYDVGEDQAEAESNGASQAVQAADDADFGGWPPVSGQLIEARYLPTSAWKRARVVKVKEESVTVVFGGYHDEVTLPAERVQPLAHERASALASEEVRFGRTGAWGAPRRASATTGAPHVELESEDERLTREMCVNIYEQKQHSGADQ